jgi:surface antigen
MKTVILGLLVSFSLIGCSSNNTYYPNMSLGENYQTNRSIYGVIANWTEHTAYDVPGVDKAEHERCVYFALDQAQLGESCKWRGAKNNSNGTVRVAQIDPNGCHYLTNTIWYKGRTKSWVDKACPKANGWRFKYHSS